MQRSACGWPTITGVPENPRPGHCRNDSRGPVNAADAVVGRLRHIEMSLGVKRTHKRFAHAGLGRQAAIAGIPLLSSASDCLYHANGRRHSISPFSRWQGHEQERTRALSTAPVPPGVVSAPG